MRHTSRYTQLRKALPLALALALGGTGSALAGEAFEPGKLTQHRGSDGIEVLSTPALKTDQLIQQHIVGYQPGQPLRIAEKFEVHNSIKEVGSWSQEGELSIWRLRVNSPNARSINFGFSRFRLPEGASLLLSSSNGKDRIRPFTAADNKPHGELWTPLVNGSSALLELRVPRQLVDQVELQIGSVNAGFVDFNDPFAAVKSGSCNVDVICPEGDEWRNQIRAVGAYTVNGQDHCSGTLINNARNDGKPYFLTAHHCVKAQATANSVVVYWNYENSTCRAPGSAASGGPGDGQRTQFTTGASLRATRKESDFTLLELAEPVNPDFNPYWAGFDARGDAPTSAVAIHHPGVDEKRISFENDPLVATGYLGDPGSGETHWRVEDWDLGTTEPGSSGSALFSPEKRIVGQLHGGYAACNNDRGDWYGRINVSWATGGTPETQLKDWLDPDNTGVLFLDGRDNAPFTLSLESDKIKVCTVNISSATLTANVGKSDPNFNGTVQLSHSGLPNGVNGSWNQPQVTPPGTSILTLSNLAAANAGNYPLLIKASSGQDELQSSVLLQVSKVVPAVAAPTAPGNGATGVSTTPTLTWGSVADATEYLVEVSTDAGFGNILHSLTVNEPTLTLPELNTNTQYYWRVTAKSLCGAANASTVFSFKTTVAPGDCSVDGTQPVAVFSENFSNGIGGFVSESGLPGVANTWELSSARPSPASGGNAMYASNGPVLTDQRLTSPSIALPENQNPLTLKFQNWRSIEKGPDNSCWDGGILEVSVDGGEFTQVTGSALLNDPYYGPISGQFNNPLGGLDGWCDFERAYAETRIDVSAYAGKSVKFRWRLGSDNSITREGWYVDDIQVQACQAGGTPPPPPPPPPGAADLGINASGTPETVFPGSEVTFLATAANFGPAEASQVKVELTLPGDMSFISAVEVPATSRKQDSSVDRADRNSRWNCASQAAVVTCTHDGPLASIAQPLLVKARIADTAAPGVLTTQVKVSAAQTDPVAANNRVDVLTRVISQALFSDGFEEANGGGGGGGDTCNVGTPDNLVVKESLNHVIGETDDMQLNLLTGQFGDYDSFTGADINWYKSFQGNLSVYLFADNIPTQGAVSTGPDQPQIAALGAGACVDENAPFTQVGGNNMQPWAAGTTGYLGIRFRNEETGQTNYGYIKMETTGPIGFPVKVTGYAYDKAGAGVKIP